MNDNLTLPRNKEIEKAVLGALLLSESPERIKEVREKAPPDCFMAQAREIYQCLCDMAEGGDSINPVMLWTRLKERNSTVDGATVAMLTDDAPIRSDLSSEIAELKKMAVIRRIQYFANHLAVESEAKDVDVASLVERIKTRAGELDSGAGAQKQPLSYSWATLCEMQFPPRETLLHEIERGEVVMCAAITNRGKTTLWRNIALSLACGREFAPVVKAGPPRVVYYLDFETRMRKLRSDITTMLGALSQDERALVSQNFHVVADCRIDKFPLSLSDPKHLAMIEDDARRAGADVVILDTLSMAFNIENENDNAEGTRIMKRLISVAERLNAVVVHLHHIGKTKQEEGQTAYNVYRSRGASAYSAGSTAIINLLPDMRDEEIITLECAKVKGERFADSVFKLDRQTRWFGFAGPQTKAVTPYDQIIEAFNGLPLKRAEVMKLFPGFPESSVDRHLKEAVKKGDLLEVKRAVYRKPDPENKSPQSPHAYRDEDFEDFPQNVDGVEDSGDLDEGAKNGVRTFFVSELTFENEEEFNEDRYLDAIDD